MFEKDLVAGIAIGNTTSPGDCPICRLPLARNVWYMIREFMEIEKSHETESNETSHSEIELQPSYFVGFLENFKLAVGEIGTEIKFGNEKDFVSNSTTLEKIENNEKLAGKDKKPVAPFGDQPQSKLSHPEAIELMVDSFSAHWASLSKNGPDSMISVITRLIRKKTASKTSDLRIKAMLDYFSSPSAVVSPFTLLFGRVIGMQPKPCDLLRPALGSVATLSLLLGCLGETCFAANELVDLDGNPSPSDFRAKLNKMSTLKAVSLRRALQILDFLLHVGQPQWSMSCLSAACVEYKSRLPWQPDSVTRLILLLFYIANKSCPISGDYSSSFPPLPTPNLVQGRRNVNRSQPSQEQLNKLRFLSLVASDLWSWSSSKLLQFRSSVFSLPLSYSNHPLLNSVVLDTQIVLPASANLFLTVSEIALVFISAWEAEAALIIHTLRSSVVTVNRRPAMCGFFDSSIASATITEKFIIGKIIDYYSSYGLEGADWDDLKRRSEEGRLPFVVPKSIFDKTPAELNFHATNLKAEQSSRTERELLEDIAASSPLPTNLNIQWEVTDSSCSLPFPPHSFAIDTQSLSSLPPYSESTFSFIDLQNQHQELSEEGEEELQPDHEPPPSSEGGLAKSFSLPQFASSHSRWKLRDTSSLTRSSSLPPLQFDKKPQRCKAETPTSFRSPYKKFESLSPGTTLVDIIEGVNKEKLMWSLLQPSTGTNRSIPTLDASSAPIQVSHGSLSLKVKFSSSPIPTNIVSHDEKLASSARQRMRARLRLDEASEQPSSPSHLPATRRKANITPVDFTKLNSIDSDDQSIAKSEVSEAFPSGTTQTNELIDSLVLRDTQILEEEFISIANQYLSVRQVGELRRIIFTNLQFKLWGAEILASKLTYSSSLLELNLEGNSLGDLGCVNILRSLLRAQSESKLQKLGLRENNITFANEELSLLGHFISLRSLDLGGNRITLDIMRQKTILSTIFGGLRNLRVFSFASNRIQDSGFTLIVQMALQSHQLKVLDLAFCYITGHSLPALHRIIECSSPRLSLLMLQGNLFLSDQTAAIRSKLLSMKISDEVVQFSQPYQGVEKLIEAIPLERNSDDIL